MHKIAKLLGLALVLTMMAAFGAQPAAPTEKPVTATEMDNIVTNFGHAKAVLAAFKTSLDKVVKDVVKDSKTKIDALNAQLATSKGDTDKARETLKTNLNAMIGDIIDLVANTKDQVKQLIAEKVLEPSTAAADLSAFSLATNEGWKAITAIEAIKTTKKAQIDKANEGA